MNAQEHAEVLVKEVVKTDVKPLAQDNARVVVISVQVGALNHVQGIVLVAVMIPVEVPVIKLVKVIVMAHVLMDVVVKKIGK